MIWKRLKKVTPEQEKEFSERMEGVPFLDKERILLEGNIPSPIKPPSGCKFHTRCYMACDKCKRVPPELREVEPGHFLACHFPEKKLDENGNYLFELPKMEKKSSRTAVQEPQA